MEYHVLEIIKDELNGKIRGRCPKCDKVIWTWENEEPKKCERCGQELKWDEKQNSNNMVNVMRNIYAEAKQREKVKTFLQSVGEAGRIADKISELILFHNRVKDNAKKRHL